MKHWKAQWRMLLAAALVVVAVWLMSLDHPRVALPVLLAGIAFFIWDTRRFRREQAEYERESEARLLALRAACERTPVGEEED